MSETMMGIYDSLDTDQKILLCNIVAYALDHLFAPVDIIIRKVRCDVYDSISEEQKECIRYIVEQEREAYKNDCRNEDIYDRIARMRGI